MRKLATIGTRSTVEIKRTVKQKLLSSVWAFHGGQFEKIDF